MKRWLISAGLMVLCWAPGLQAGQAFRDLVGPVPVGEVKGLAPVQVPIITWGGDFATLWANGGLETRPGSIYQKLGLNVKLVKADDFVQQVRDYLAGKSPFLRGTTAMVGMPTELAGADARTKPMMLFQLTWSVGGDHCVVRADRIRTLKDLKGKTGILQQGGPHEGFLDELLRDAGLTWSDVTVTWAKDLMGPNGAAEAFRKNDKLDFCFVITPDMLGLTGGLPNTGDGAEGTVKGARVLVSTAERSRSIADVYVCRKDFADAHRDWVTQFTAGYLKACEELVELQKKYEAGDTKPLTEFLKQVQKVYGEENMPSLEADVYGTLCDCRFVGHPGNVAFFGDPNNLHGIKAFEKAALDLAQTRGYTAVRQGFLPTPLDWNGPAFSGYLQKTDAARPDRFRAEAVLGEIEALTSRQMDDRTIYDFAVEFKPNEKDFSALQYGVQFQKVVELADRYGNAVIAIRGHSDPTKVLFEAIEAGKARKILERRGTAGSYTYFLRGSPLNLDQTPEVLALIEQGEFDGVSEHNPREYLQAALNLSRARAEAVKKSVIDYAQTKGLKLDASQIQPLGVGVREPLVPKPRNEAEAAKNMRVEFRLLRVSAEAVNPTEFDF